MSDDISRILDGWPYGEGTNVRRITGDDGREKLQLRICVDSFHGLLQLECDGRPDGKRPHNRDFYLDHLLEKQRRFVASGGADVQFRLTHTQCRKLYDESTMVYRRYVLLLQLGDFGRVVRDTARNMRLFEFVHTHAMHASDRAHLECYWPYILRIHYTALAMEDLTRGGLDKALAKLGECRTRLAALPPQESQIFRVEMKRSLEALRQMEGEISARLPRSELDDLERKKNAAIREQRYEDAARLRDKIQSLRARLPGSPSTAGNSAN